MGRSRKNLALQLWMNGEFVGQWRINAQGEHELLYDNAWVNSPQGRPISLSMPLRPADVPYRGEVVRNFFENLLPDNRLIRQRLARRFNTGPDAFALLSEVGRDCVGALQLLPEGQVPPNVKRIQATPWSEAQIERHLAGLPLTPALGVPDDGALRLSLAGAQEKTAFLWHQGQWCRPEGSTPTTHIFKLPLGQTPGGIDLTTSVENEWLCMQLLRAYDVPTATVAMLQFGAQKVLGVERFDRRLASAGWWLRLPQEDFAQVLGVDPAHKYEDSGGPGVKLIADQLLGSSSAAQDRADFFRTLVLFWMLAAIDGHAKNFSVAIEPRGLFHLTPRYDVLSAYPMMGTRAGQLSPQKVRMAMAVWKINRHYRWSEMRRAHFEHTAKACRIPHAAQLIDELVERTPQALQQVRQALPEKFPTAVARSILAGVQQAAKTLSAKQR